MKRFVFNTIYLSLLVALFYAVKDVVDPVAWDNFWAFMAGDYLVVWRRHIEPNIPPATHPISLIVLAIFALGLIRLFMGKKHGG